MKYKAGGIAGAIVLLVIIIGAFFAPSVAQAQDGDSGWACPADTTFSYKIDNLSGPTFEVPDVPDGWYLTGVVLKAGTEHLLITPVTEGQILDVKTLMGHDVSHVHICKNQTSPETTVPETTLPETTIPEETTTVPSCVDCTPITQVTVPGETTTTTVVGPTTTANSPVSSTTDPGATTTLALCVMPGQANPNNLPPCALPPTGILGLTLITIALGMLVLGTGAISVARRRR